MHFVAEDEERILVRTSKNIFSQATGEKTGVLPTIWFQSRRGVAPDWAVHEAVKFFSFDKRPRPGSDGGADIPVERWCVYVDTAEWQETFKHPDEIRERLEELLSANARWLEVTPPAQKPPWPNYDDLTVQGQRTAGKVAERNLETAALTGVSVEDLIVYEEATLKREGVLAAYRAALPEESAEPETFALAVEA